MAFVHEHGDAPGLALTVVEREEISRGLMNGDSLRVIAASLGRAASTVSREVRRNGGLGQYPAAAESTPHTHHRDLEVSISSPEDSLVRQRVSTRIGFSAFGRLRRHRLGSRLE